MGFVWGLLFWICLGFVGFFGVTFLDLFWICGVSFLGFVGFVWVTIWVIFVFVVFFCGVCLGVTFLDLFGICGVFWGYFFGFVLDLWFLFWDLWGLFG